MFAHTLARLTLLCGLLVVANGCCHCGTCKPGIVDCLVGGSCNDNCNSGCSGGCNTGCNTCNQGCGLGNHIRNKMVCAPQFGGETYRGNSCGQAYYGDWKSHPPCADPCDCYGNNTGCANCCQDCSHLNRGRYCGLKGFFKSAFDCQDCDSGCDSCTSCGNGGVAKSGCTTCGH